MCPTLKLSLFTNSEEELSRSLEYFPGLENKIKRIQGLSRTCGKPD